MDTDVLSTFSEWKVSKGDYRTISSRRNLSPASLSWFLA